MATGMIQCGSLLLLVSLSMIMASVIVKEQDNKMVLNRHARGAGCIINGTTYPDGSNFTIGVSGPCILYQCNNGVYSSISLKCQLGASYCFDIGTTVVIDCTTYSCSHLQFNNGTSLLRTSIASSKCTDINGECHDAGSFFRLNYQGNPWNCTCAISATWMHSYTCHAPLCN